MSFLLFLLTLNICSASGFLGILPDVVPLRKTSSGPVIGYIRDLNQTEFVHVYLGIPYAKPPVGNLRFRSPQSPTIWTEPLWCRHWKSQCIRSFSVSRVPQSEDCLYLNVFTGPNCTDDHKCPVIVYPHGGQLEGQFDIGKIKNEIVIKGFLLVNVEFRTGVFGFGQFKVSDSNNGIKDVLKALDWVQTNAEAFGGDNKSVTVIGRGIGAQMASLLTLIPGIETSISRTIQLDGTAYTPSTFQSLQQTYQQLENELGCNGDKSTVDNCMRHVDAWKLQDTYEQILKQSCPKSCLITDPPLHIEFDDIFVSSNMTRSSVPLMIGTTLIQAKGDCSDAVKCLKVFSHSEEIANACEKDYLEHPDDNPLADVLLLSPTFTEASKSRKSGAEVYLFDTVVSSDMIVGYMFGGTQLYLTADQTTVVEDILKAMLNFAQFGNPTTDSNETIWHPLKKPIGFNYVSVGLNGTTNEPFYHYRSITFWQAVAPIVEFVITKTEADQLALHAQKLTALWVTVAVLGGALLFTAIPICLLKCHRDKQIKSEEEFLVDDSDRLGLLCSHACYPNYGTNDTVEPLMED